MKYVLGIYACLVIAVVCATAQQEPPSKQTPSIQPTAEALMKAQAAADKAQAKREEPFAEELKKLVDREIAKSAALPVMTTVQEPIKQIVLPDSAKDSTFESKIGLVVIDGVLYLRTGKTIMPMPGSGCFLPQEEHDARTQRAQAKFAEMSKLEPVKKD